MTKKPDWEEALSSDVECAIGISVDCGGTAGVHYVRDVVLRSIEPHIKAAEQRGFSAAASKVGQRQAAEIKELKTKLDQVRDLVREYREGQDRGLMPVGRAFVSWVQDVVGPKAD
jgi:hypothetical protein